ncbi:MAG: orotate phosphoribosyltransferase [Clostridia bacterium]|nr:orotate phosphoribosyltransferase [Clostridia bacterium]
MLTNEGMIRIFEETEGIKKGHFQLASGRHADTYMQCAKLFMYPDKSRLLCKELAERLTNKEQIEFVASPAIGGIIMGYEMAAQLKVPNIFLERIDGKLTMRRGFSFAAGTKFLVVEDVVTTGGSVFETIEEIERFGGVVVAVACIVDRSNGKVDFMRPLTALLSLDIISYDKTDCPLCKEGIELTKPGTKALGK